MPSLAWDFPHRNRADWLQAGDLETGEVYLCYARGARVAVFGGTGFFVPKDDFGVKFLERQMHWNDVSAHGLRGTVKPFERLEINALRAPALSSSDLEPFLGDVWRYDDPAGSFMNDDLYHLRMEVQRRVMKRWGS